MKRTLLLFTSLYAILALLLARPSSTARYQSGQASRTLPDPTDRLARLPTSKTFGYSSVMFIENVGQFDDRARFQVGGALGGHTWLADDAVWIAMLEPIEEWAHLPRGSGISAQDGPARPGKGVHLKLSLVGANPSPRIVPFNRLETKVSYFSGNDPDGWHAAVPVWAGVRYTNVYPGVDLELRSHGGQWSWELACKAGCEASLGDVRLRVEGAADVHVQGGSLRLATDVGEFSLPLLRVVGTTAAEQAAVTRIGEDVHEVSAPFYGEAYVQEGSPGSSAQTEIPPNLMFGTYVGGDSDDYSEGCAVDEQGNLVITGHTSSSDFPTTPGAFDPGDPDASAFIFKLSADGTSLLYSTLVGLGRGKAVTLVPGGQAVVTGRAFEDFPTTPGAYDRDFNGSADVFVLKLSADGSTLLYSTYVGGSSWDEPSGLGLDSAENVVVAGRTSSGSFPSTVTAVDREQEGASASDEDVFVFKLSANLSSLLYSTKVGGGGSDYATAMALDPVGNAVVTGFSYSPGGFPTTPGAYDLTPRRSFVFKLSADGGSLVYSTFLGGSLPDMVRAVAVDRAGNAVVTGQAKSSDFPFTEGAYDTTYNGGQGDVFVSKLSADGSSLLYSTFVGGSDDDTNGDDGTAVVLDDVGNALVAVWADAKNFPVTPGGYDLDDDALAVLKLSADGGSLLHSSFVGPAMPTGIAQAPDGSVLLAGYIFDRYVFPTTPGAYDRESHARYDVVAARVALPHLEINQGLGRQISHTPRFVAGKDTAIRVFLPSPVSYDPAGQQVLVERDGQTVTTLTPSHFLHTADVLTFLCRPLEACGNWQAGTYTFTATVGELVYQATAQFEPRRDLRILAVPVRVKVDGVIQEVPDGWQRAGEFLQQVYPIAADGLDWKVDTTVLNAKPRLGFRWLDLTDEDDQNRLIELLNWRQLWCYAVWPPPSGCYDAIIGFIPPMAICSPDPCLGDCGCTKGWVHKVNRVAMVMANESYDTPCAEEPEEIDYMGAVVAHEVGHTLGLGEEYRYADGERYECDINPPPPQYENSQCEPACPASTEQPWPDPDTGEGSLIRGALYHPFALPGTTLPGQDPGALDDKDMLSFMGSGSHQQDFWVSPRVYNHLFHQLAPVASSPAVPGSEQEVVIASGWMGQDDSITLQPWYQITATPGATISGTYAIEAVDVLSQPLASQGFDVSFVLLSDPPAELDSAPFHVGVASPPGTEAFRIKKGETVLEVVHPSPNAPGVTITNPGPGETVSGTYAITWDATDLDGDQLNHLVEYSHDSQEWLVLAGPITETQIVADFSVLPGGDQARVRVWTSDGVNTAEATSGAFLVATKPPKVYLDAPASGTCHPAGMNLTFSGAAYDLQDGWLRSATALVWTSDRDGTLGGGEVLYLHDLSVGRHTITLSATNSTDQTTVADTELMIGFCQYLPLVWRIGD